MVTSVNISCRWMLRPIGSTSSGPQSTQSAPATNTGSATQPPTGASSQAATTLMSTVIGSTTNMGFSISGMGQRFRLTLIHITQGSASADKPRDASVVFAVRFCTITPRLELISRQSLSVYFTHS